MAWNHYPDAQAFSAFMNSFGPQNPGAGVDHQFGPRGGDPRNSWPMFNMGWGAWDGQHRGGGPGGRCRRGRGGFSGDRGPASRERGHHDGQNDDTDMTEKDDSPDTIRQGSDDAPDPPESIPNPNDHGPHHWHGHRGFGRRRGMPGRFPHGPHHGPGHHHGPPGPPPPPPPPGPPGDAPHPPPPPPFPFGGGQPWFHALANHPLAQAWREMMGDSQRGTQDNEQDGDHFAPPVDVFRTDGGWVLHMAVPGAKKEDIGVHWDAEKSTLFVSGVVHRPGDEAFLQGLVSGERKVGLFKREVKLPPVGASSEQRGDRDEIDDTGITAKLEDGVLVVSVPVVEKEWTQVRKVDIE